MWLNARVSVRTSTLGELNSCLVGACLNTDGKTSLDKTLHSFEWKTTQCEEVIYVKVKQPSLNRGGGLRYHLFLAYNAVLKTVPDRFKDEPICHTSQAEEGGITLSCQKHLFMRQQAGVMWLPVLCFKCHRNFLFTPITTDNGVGIKTEKFYTLFY